MLVILIKEFISLDYNHSFSFLVISNSKTVHVLSHSEYPASSFAFAEQSHSQMLVADNTFIALMNKLKTLRVFEVRLPKMEARGTRLEYQDFVINLATVNQTQTTKGLVLEVNNLLSSQILHRSI
jgi:hypothetical protein